MAGGLENIKRTRFVIKIRWFKCEVTTCSGNARIVYSDRDVVQNWIFTFCDFSQKCEKNYMEYKQSSYSPVSCQDCRLIT